MKKPAFSNASSNPLTQFLKLYLPNSTNWQQFEVAVIENQVFEYESE